MTCDPAWRCVKDGCEDAVFAGTAHCRKHGVTDLELFHVDEPVPDPEPAEKLSADRRRTLRQKAAVASGVHPLMGGKARPELGTCGDCTHRLVLGYHNRSWPKCELAGITHGAGTDCRAWWPACGRYEPGDQISDDAARWTPAHAEVSS